MKPEKYTAKKLTKLFRKKKIATMDELKDALGTRSDMTVFRKLQELGYCTSYSHGGRYYVLSDVAEFDELGLWSFESIYFSKHGTLLATAEACVDSAEAGYFTNELDEMLHVSVKDALLKLVNEGQIVREKFSGKYLYCSTDSSVRKKQIQFRQFLVANHTKAMPALLPLGAGVCVVSDEMKAGIVLFFSLLDEQQRRLYAGLESLKLGHGGDRKMAELLGLDVSTVARGRKELLEQDVDTERVRKAGGGRPTVEKKRQK
jgi:hypothetical protein